MIIKRLHSLVKNSGYILFILRLPGRFIKYFLDTTTTYFYQLTLRSCGKGVRIQHGVHIESPKRVSIGNNVFIGKGTIINSENFEGTLTLANDVHVGTDCHIDHTGNLFIDESTLLSENVFIYTHSHGVDPRSKPIPISKSIGKHVWLGVDTMILESCEQISDSIILGARSVASKKLTESHSIYVGTPAKKIRPI